MGFTYSMVKSGPDVSADEVESHQSAIEVIILWNSIAFHVSHLSPPRSFYVGEEFAGKLRCDCFIPSETLGTTRAPIVRMLERSESADERPGDVRMLERSESADRIRRAVASLVILRRSTGYVDIPGEGRVDLADLISSGRAAPSIEVKGAYEYELPAQAKAHIEFDQSLVFEVSVVSAGKRLPGGFLAVTEPDALLYTGLSFLVHAGIVVALAFFMPSMRADDGQATSRDQIVMMQKLLNAASEREPQERELQASRDTRLANEGGTGAAAAGQAGTMGDLRAREAAHRYGVEGPKENPDPHIARAAALEQIRDFGAIGLLAAMGADPNAPTAPWGREQSLGKDERSALGNLFGDDIGVSPGIGGLGLSGMGEGSDGHGQGIGLDNFGDLGHGAGRGTGEGVGVGRGRPNGGHVVSSPRMREPAATVCGVLRPEVIQRIVHQNFGRFRYCYEKALRSNPNLQGRVSAKFVIDRTGAVATSADGGSDLPDQGVVQCIVREFSNLSFPAPEGGIVTVVYPFVLTPGE